MLPDDQLDALLRDAKPRAPAGFEDRVMSRVKRPYALMFAAAAVVVVAMAGVGSLFVFRHGASAPRAVMPIGSPHVPRPWLVADQSVKHVEGPAELERAETRVSLFADGSIDVVDQALVL